MTNQEAVMTLMVVEENISCDDCLYYSQMEDCPTDDNCIVAKAIWKAINALSAIEGIKAEIEHLTCRQYEYKLMLDREEVLEIIDKHTKGDSE